MTAVKKAVGRSPTRLDCRRVDPKLQTLAEYRFGSWNEAKKQLGFRTNKPYGKLDEDTLIKDLRKWFRTNKRPPWGKLEGYFGHSYRLYVRRFGSIQKAYKKAGIRREGKKYIVT